MTWIQKGNLRLANDMFPDDLFTAGTRLNLFYKTRFVGGTTWFLSPDTTGGNYFEMEILPSSMDADSTFNCVLYVDHGGSQNLMEAGLSGVLAGGSSNYENTAWDRYDIVGPDSRIMALGRPLETEYGASLVQALGYKAILWDTGNGASSVMEKVDGDLLIPWLTLVDFDFNNLYMTGDGLARGITLNNAAAPSAAELLGEYAGVVWGCDTFGDAGCPAGTPLDNIVCVNLDPVAGSAVARCPAGL